MCRHLFYSCEKEAHFHQGNYVPAHAYITKGRIEMIIILPAASTKQSCRLSTYFCFYFPISDSYWILLGKKKITAHVSFAYASSLCPWIDLEAWTPSVFSAWFTTRLSEVSRNICATRDSKSNFFFFLPTLYLSLKSSLSHMIQSWKRHEKQ